MITLGITGRRRGAASALAVDGRIVAAVSEAIVTRVPDAGYGDVGFPVASASACLRLANVPPEAVGRIVSVGRRAPAGGPVEREAPPGGWREPLERADMSPLLTVGCARVSPLAAHAWQALGSNAGPALVLTVDSAGSAALFAVRDGAPVLVRELPGVASLAALVVSLAGRLGWLGGDGTNAVEFLELLATAALQPLDERFLVAVSAQEIDAAVIAAAAHREIDEIEGEVGASLHDTASVNVGVQRARAAAAAAFLDRVAAALADLVARWRSRARVEPTLVAGDLFSSAAFLWRLRQRCGPSLRSAPVPEREGLALGAALAAGAQIASPAIDRVALGPSFTETEAKAALENARLDYLYEPRWDRLLARVSRLLARGKLVAWFQGPAEFGPRSLGGRSVLADPSDRYARDNINRFLKQRDERSTLPVSVAPDIVSVCFESGALSPWMLERAEVRPEHRDRFRSALDATGRVTYHTVAESSNPGLAELLRVHREQTGAPALINTTLAGPGEPTACSPRDAVRTFFSSALDALVVHRFLLMKDYWQMRSEGE